MNMWHASLHRRHPNGCPSALLLAGGLGLVSFLSAWASAAQTAGGPATGPLRVCPGNPRYFATPDGRPILLAGAHDGWELQDFAWGDTMKEQPFEWERFLDLLTQNGHNVIRLWVVEHTKINDADADRTQPMPWRRVPGHGRANDGGDKFDLDQFNPAYFKRLRQRVRQARDRGIYVIVMLFQGWSIEDKGGKVNPWPYHPFHARNNLNGVNGDLDGDGQGRELHTWLGADHPITRRQRAYVRQVIDTVNDLDNVLFEIANESHADSLEWQNRMVDFTHAYERTKPRQHPAGITVPAGGARRTGLNRALFASHADWISPNREAPRGYNYRDNPPPATGRKVVLLDSDHLHGNHLRDARWVWKAFCRGDNVLFMDRWTEAPNDPQRQQVRRALGQVVRWSRRLDLARTQPSVRRASTGFCLETPGRAYLIYAPAGGAFTVDLKGVAGTFRAEWFQSQTGRRLTGETVSGGARQPFTPSFPGPAVLYLQRTAEADSPPR